jgi:transcriptional regulator with XRE-family HTH domain
MTPQERRTQQARIRSFVKTCGSTRAVAMVTGMSHTVIWRAMNGKLARGASLELVRALAEFTQEPMDYWCGKAETTQPGGV